MTKNINNKSWNTPVSWDNWHYPVSSHVPSMVAPSLLTATVSGSTIALSWTNGLSNVYTIVERSNTGSSGWVPIATKNPGVTSHSDTSLANGTYYYRVYHYLNSVSSSVSNTDNDTVATGGAISDGETVTVTVAGAGSNIPASQFQFLGGSYGPIESGTIGNLFTTIAPSGWDMPGGTGTYISDVESLNGGKSLLHDRSLGYQFGFAYNTGGIRRVGFARWSVLFQNPSNIEGGQLKQVRMVGGTSSRLEDYSYANMLLSGWTGTGGVYAARNDSPSPGTNLSGGAGREWHKDNEWVSVHLRVTDSSAANVADASIQVMTIRESDGSILGVWEQNNVLLRTSAEALIRNIVFQFYMGNNFNGASGCKVYIDRDIACAYSNTTTPPKFVYLGNASTWSACTVRTYCEWTSWTDNGSTSDITIKVNQGRHTSLSGLYVYVLSDAGTVVNSTGVPLTGSETQLFSTDFSVDYTGFNYSGADRRTIVTANPPPGKTHSVRFNLKNNVTDPITGKLFTTSSNIYTGNFVHNINTKDYNSVTYIMPFRFDDFQWGGYDTTSLLMDAKLVYISNRGYSTENGFYLAGGGTRGMGGSSGNLNWGDNGSWGDTTDWQNSSIGWRNGSGNPTGSTLGSTNTAWGTDGQWHVLKIQFIFNYTDSYGTYTRARALIDDVAATGSSANYDVDGWTRLPPGFTPDVIRTVYGNTSGSTSVNSSIDRTGAAAGLQIGDLELWRGVV